ncbi:DNA polymerase [Streptomyces sp. CdTB01]|uniref:DNA polymerase Y family protein n=1 Tax=Streptomyces sp. CdTB01 TaxID=1725411 RepID=UPI00073A5A09|nr:DNA polymerase [Streptomyces sp. CdTB01]ALV39403.1 DNA polymerase [Streptomyces sp. CdTB01]
MSRRILRLSFDLPPGADAELPERLRRLLEDFTPRVQMLEDGAVLDLTGAMRWWQRDARGITELVQLRVLAYFGVRSSAAVAGTPMLAAMACALTPLGQRTVIGDSPEAIAGFLRPRPVRELPGVGGKTATLLGEYGLHTVGDVADVPQLTLQRLLGARAGRTLHERAHGRDTTVVDPDPAPASISSEHRFARDELDPAAHRRALLALADDLGTRLRTSDQIAQGLTCTIRYADGSGTRRSRTLPEATQHTVLLARTAYPIYESLGLQRARVRSIALRADALRPADRATRQLTLDAGDDKPLVLEAVADRARARYGHQVIYPAALAITSPPPSPRHRGRGGQTEDAQGGRRRAT